MLSNLLITETNSEPDSAGQKQRIESVPSMRFIDLFAGLGGFHKALSELGHRCVFGSELNPLLRENYRRNFNVELRGDIRKVRVEDIPPFDILCAGFPCQSFSKAGKQKGIEDERGALFNNILEILGYHLPKFFILENVPQLARHNNQRTWQLMRDRLIAVGYAYVDFREYSPHEFGIPQHRRRLYIVGSLEPQPNFAWIEEQKVSKPTDVRTVLDPKPENVTRLDAQQEACIDVWQEFLDILDKDEPIGFPIWAFEFGATYPYRSSTPFSCSDLSAYSGSFGHRLEGETHLSELLPSYARTEEMKFPAWKQNYISLNRKLYQKYESRLKLVVPKIAALPLPSWRKFEWNCQFESRTIRDKILQFRASGLRVKKSDYVPSLVCTNTQIPIIGWEGRYITMKEALRLQSFPEDFSLPLIGHAAFVALGNAVNVQVVRLIAQALLSSSASKTPTLIRAKSNNEESRKWIGKY